MARISQATLKDVAKLAGVSTSTASRALAGNPAISEATRAKVADCAQRLEYQPNEQARGLRQSRTNTIGLVVPSLVNPYFAEMATVIQRNAAKVGLTTLIANTNEGMDELRQALEMMISKRVDGLIVVPSEGVDDILLRARDARLPLVMLDRALEIEGITSVCSDPVPGIEAAVQHLKEKGHTPIGYLSGPLSTSTGRERVEAFEQACDKLGVDKDMVYSGGYERSEGRSGAQSLLKQGAKSLIAGDSMMTIGVLEHCHEHGVVIGEDVAVVGFDNYSLFELQPKPITIIDQNVAQMSEKAMSILHTLIEAKQKNSTVKAPAPQALKMDTALVVRQSTDFDKA